MEKSRDQLIHELGHYRDLRGKVTDDKLQAALDELIRVLEETIGRMSKP